MRTLLITGCCGFIGRVAWDYFQEEGFQVIGIDDLSRTGCCNLPSEDEFYDADINRIEDLPLPRIDAVLHLAAQVSVTRSLSSPVRDFNTNAAGTFHLALWARRHAVSRFIYASTNKVFGPLPHRAEPVGDDQPINPTTPYGISKAVGGLYVRELLPEMGWDFRQSCIYGDTQTGSEDQGWVAHILRQIREGKRVTCYGDGSQVRDLLHVDDLMRVYRLAVEGLLLPGSYVVGGGAENAHSFREVIEMLGGKIHNYEAWRHDDQRYFVSRNDGLLRAHAPWNPSIPFASWAKKVGRPLATDR